MARMIPANPNDFHGSQGEGKIFKALESLPNGYTVFYSYRWTDSGNYGTVNGEADFIIFHRLYGMIVIEAKSGGIAFENNVWEYIRTDTRERIPMGKNPLEQANNTKYHLVNFVKALCRRDERCQVEPVAWFPSIERTDVRGQLPNTYNDYNTLFLSSLYSPEDAIAGAYQYYKCDELTNLSQNTFDRIVSQMAPEFHAIPSLRTKFDEQEREYLLLAKEQESLLDYLDEQPTAAIQGCAGTGKTLLAVEKARRLSKSGKVLFLCFNRHLMSHLREIFKNADADVDCYNLPSLYMREVQTAEMPSDDEISEFLSEYQDYGWQYKHIVIDEGQDFADEHIEWLSLIAQNANGSFYVFFDKNQLVQQSEIPKWLQNAECRLVLRQNRRNTAKIATTSGKCIDLEPIMASHSPDGQPPTLHIIESKDEFILRLREIIANYIQSGIRYDEIVILTAKTESESLLSELSAIGNYKLTRERNLKSEILFTTTRKFKGLEAAVVIICDVDAETFRTEEGKRLFYVAASRAKNALEIITLQTDDELKELANAVSGGKSSKKSAIASTLKVKLERAK